MWQPSKITVASYITDLYFPIIDLLLMRYIYCLTLQEVVNPKLFEQNRRDKGKEAACHSHIAFTPSTSTPTPWKSFFYCRKYNASIIEALGLSFIQIIRQKLLPGQTLYLSGCFPQNSNTIFSGNSFPVSIYSPDTDEYNIGLFLSIPEGLDECSGALSRFSKSSQS